jgi:hypothetical protein
LGLWSSRSRARTTLIQPAQCRSFFDTSGSPIQSPPITGIAAAFKSYYATVNGGGSTFVAQVTFTVVGSVATIGAVTVAITNAAGVSNTGSLTFQ